MAKKVLIISTSLRGGSNSDILANECAKGAKEAGHDVELLSLKGKDIKYCIGCLSCQRTGMCVQKDDVADIMAKVNNGVHYRIYKDKRRIKKAADDGGCVPNVLQHPLKQANGFAGEDGVWLHGVSLQRQKRVAGSGHALGMPF